MKLGTVLSFVFMFIMAFTSRTSLYAQDKQLESETIPTPKSKVYSFENNDTIKKGPRITPGVPSEYDWIKLLNGKELEVEVKRISDKFVFFSRPDDANMDWIDREEVEAIYYRTGSVEKMAKIMDEKRETKDWREVRVTREPEHVANMARVEDLEIRYEPTTRNHNYRPKTLENNAEIALQRQAALLKADIILITSVNHHRAYGVPPIVIMQAEAYRKR